MKHDIEQVVGGIIAGIVFGVLLYAVISILWMGLQLGAFG